MWGAAITVAASAIAGAETTAPAGAQQEKQEQQASDPALVSEGKATYAEKCSHCHGFGMVNAGTVAPDLRRFPDDRPRFFTTVKMGRNNKMPPWGDLLSDDQIACLWAYVSSQRKP
jgi:mono/diheme cytochrome c family protein